MKEIESGLIADYQDWVNIARALDTEMFKRRFLSGIHQGYGLTISDNLIKFSYRGFVTDDTATNYVVRKVSEMIQHLGIKHLCMVQSALLEPMLGDTVVKMDVFKLNETANALLLNNLVKAEQIPEKYLCQLTNQLMDEPVHTKQRPDVHYDKEQVTYWLYSNGIPKDPITQQTINPINDLIANPELKEEITQYVRNELNNGLLRKREAAQLFRDTMHKYTVNITKDSIDKAFRRTAAENNIQDMDIILPKVSDINAQDDNPVRRRTALHWAIEKNSLETVKRLLELNAKTNIKDAAGKTAVDYAKDSNNEWIKSLLLGSTENITKQLRAVNF